MEKRQVVLDDTLSAARQRERDLGRPHYVVWDVPRDTWVITTRMPRFGRWYSADGTRHG